MPKFIIKKINYSILIKNSDWLTQTLSKLVQDSVIQTHLRIPFQLIQTLTNPNSIYL